jgi:hypothetical protein
VSVLRRIALSLLVPLVLLVGLLLGTGPAAAACPESPSPSPYAFTGVVTKVRNDGRVATVRTDNGRTVQVIGGETGANQSSSVDRRYAVGGRYEFHPRNATSPYLDDSCSATRQLSGPAYDRSMNSHTPSGTPLVIGGLVIVALIAVPTLVRRFRRPDRSASG